MIETEHRDSATWLRIARPERRNAFDPSTVRALLGGIEAAEADPACRVLVVTGKGDTFCAGRDLGREVAGTPLEDVHTEEAAWSNVLDRLRRMSKPSLAVVRGHAVAGGFTLAMGCDFVIAERAARFGALEMRGGFPAAVNAGVLAHLVGPRKALEYLLSDETYPAEHLLAAGLLNAVAEDADALSGLAEAWIARLVRLDPLAVRLTKETHRAVAAMPIADALVVGRQLNALLAVSGKIDAGARRHADRSRGGTVGKHTPR
jgi:enoyl-CoA hydratase/carnithine racemase